MKIACAQMDVHLGDSAYNYAHALELIRKAAAAGADTVLLPETFNIGFFPRENLAELADRDGEIVKMTPMGGDYLIEIDFEQLGTKKLMLRAAAPHMSKEA